MVVVLVVVVLVVGFVVDLVVVVLVVVVLVVGFVVVLVVVGIRVVAFVDAPVGRVTNGRFVTAALKISMPTSLSCLDYCTSNRDTLVNRKVQYHLEMYFSRKICSNRIILVKKLPWYLDCSFRG
jgi:hypothetical protein